MIVDEKASRGRPKFGSLEGALTSEFRDVWSRRMQLCPQGPRTVVTSATWELKGRNPMRSEVAESNFGHIYSNLSLTWKKNSKGMKVRSSIEVLT